MEIGERRYTGWETEPTAKLTAKPLFSQLACIYCIAQLLSQLCMQSSFIIAYLKLFILQVMREAGNDNVNMCILLSSALAKR